MCGIAGWAGEQPPEFIIYMLEAIKHRGPDDEGTAQFPNSVIGFRRLSIIDLETGHQPFYSESNLIAATVNGEIYNYLELRDELKKLGHTFKTNSDGEVVVHAYEEWGDKCFERLEGMFACAVWDDDHQELTLARDHLGKKPLYYTSDKSGIRYGSELKSLNPQNSASLPIDVNALFHFLISDSVPTPETLWKNIYKLEPGSILKWKNYQIEIKRFWPKEIFKEINLQTDQAVLESFEKELRSSVKKRLSSDVPVGIFLSGGVDSQLIAGLASQSSNTKLKSFTLKFHSDSFDESESAKVFARSVGLKHTEIILGTSELIHYLEKFVDIFDEPINDPACLAQLALSESAQNNGVKVAITGDGGDELFMGYQHVKAHQLVQKIPLLSSNLAGSASKLAVHFPDSGSYFSPGFKIQRIARGMGISDFVSRDFAWRGAFRESEANEILKNHGVSLTLDIFKNRFEESPFKRDDFDKWSWLYLRSYLMDTVLVKVDRATMAYGVEARSPLLDKNIVEMVLGLPSSFKLGKFGNKRLLRTILQNSFPENTALKAKHGMGIPVVEMLRGPLSSRFKELTSNEYISHQNIFDQKFMDKLVKDFYLGKTDRRKEAWGIFVFQLWFLRWQENTNHPTCELEK